MPSLARGDSVDPLGGKVDRQAAGEVEHLAVGIEPAPRARERQIAISDDSIGPRAGTGERALLDPVAGARHQDRPVTSAALGHKGAERLGAVRAAPLGQRHRLCLDPCQFEQIVTRIGSTAVAQGQQPPLAVGTRRAVGVHQGSSRAASKARTGAMVESAMIASTAAKLIWKLGPIALSGHDSSTKSPATASIRSDSASRPSTSAPSTSSAATQLRTVGASALAATTGWRTRKASADYRARSLSTAK